MVAKLECAYRVDTSSDSLRVAYPTGGGYTSLTLAATLQQTAAALASALDTAVKSVNANLSCAVSGAVYTFASAGLNFDLELTDLTLRDWLGFASTTYANKASQASDVTGGAPSVFVGTRSWHSDEWTWVRARKVHDFDHARQAVIHVAAWREWSVVAALAAADVAKFRSVLAYMLRGTAGTWYRNDADAAAWSYSNSDGTSLVVLAPDSMAYADRWVTRPHQTELEVPLRCIEYSA